jgi:hypothetical protein
MFLIPARESRVSRRIDRPSLIERLNISPQLGLLLRHSSRWLPVKSQPHRSSHKAACVQT